MERQNMRDRAQRIVRAGIGAVLPEAAVRKALSAHPVTGEVTVVAIGKAAWRMASAACDTLGDQVRRGVVVTKYGHGMGPLPPLEIVEAGHPVPDENSVLAARKALALADACAEGEQVLLLLSGGGSALFEAPLPGVTLEEIAGLTRQLLASGADITEMNILRKRLSAVKGGRFAQRCAPARIRSIVLSDVLGDDLASIASGPACADPSTRADAEAIVARYGIGVSAAVNAALRQETPKALCNVSSEITGSVRELCAATAAACQSEGYRPYVLTTALCCEAREAGGMLASMAREVRMGGSCFKAPCALILGGETVVHLKGKGRGGRNQELAAAAGAGIDGLENVCVVSYGSDGTDGPTDAAGGMVDGLWAADCRARGLSIADSLAANDTYPLLKRTDALLITGPTGTNVNDAAFALIGE